MVAQYVDQCMSAPAETVPRTATVSDAAARLVGEDLGALVVTDSRGRIAGLLTATDVVRIVGDGTLSPETTVAEVMETDVLTTTRDTSVGEVAATMVDHLVHHVPVVEGGEVVGMLSTLDLTAQLATPREHAGI